MSTKKNTYFAILALSLGLGSGISATNCSKFLNQSSLPVELDIEIVGIDNGQNSETPCNDVCMPKKSCGAGPCI